VLDILIHEREDGRSPFVDWCDALDPGRVVATNPSISRRLVAVDAYAQQAMSPTVDVRCARRQQRDVPMGAGWHGRGLGRRHPGHDGVLKFAQSLGVGFPKSRAPWQLGRQSDEARVLLVSEDGRGVTADVVHSSSPYRSIIANS